MSDYGRILGVIVTEFSESMTDVIKGVTLTGY